MLLLHELEDVAAYEKKEFHLKTLTPLFMHGWQSTETRNDGKTVNKPLRGELRPPSFKGVWRYWWRTLQVDHSAAQLLTQEQQLFGGSSGSQERGIRSPVSLSVVPLLKSTDSALLRPHRNANPVRAVPQGRKFSLVIAVRKRDANQLPYYVDALGYTLLLAGFGQRCRRGGGALQWDGYRWDGADDFQETLRQSIIAMGAASHFIFGDPSGDGPLLQRQTGKAGHPVLGAVWLGQPYHQAEKARSDISAAASAANPPGRDRIQYLGSVTPKRIASPIHATVRCLGSSYYPVISEVVPVPSGERQQPSKGYLDARNMFLARLGVRL